MTTDAPVTPEGYKAFLRDLKGRIRKAQLRASLSVNRELVLLYWNIGKDILERQRALGWGAKVIERLASDLRTAFPEMKGFSSRNLKYMRAFAKAHPDEQIVQQAAAQIPWFHNCVLLDKVKDPTERLWYAQADIQYGWSRSVLIHQIETDLYHRQGKALTNFDRTLPAPQSDMTREVLKDPYTFDFLSIGPEARERDLERGLIEHIRDFLLELGTGFAFVGSQYPLEVGRQDFFLDLLFYHLRLRCHVVVDLKVREFQPEFVGKMNFYLSAVDDLLRHTDDQPSVGIILCKTRNEVIVEYALRDTSKPMGVATYQLTKALPDHLKRNLPAIEELEAELMGADEKETSTETDPK